MCSQHRIDGFAAAAGRRDGVGGEHDCGEHSDAVSAGIHYFGDARGGNAADGDDRHGRIRADARLGDMPVIMLTGHEDIASIDRAYQVGATSFVAKPVNWRQLSYQIRYVIRTTRKKHTRLHDDPAASMRISLEQIIARLDDLTGKIPSGCWPLSYDDIRSAREIAQRALATLSVKPDRSEAAQGEKNVAA